MPSRLFSSCVVSRAAFVASSGLCIRLLATVAVCRCLGVAGRSRNSLMGPNYRILNFRQRCVGRRFRRIGGLSCSKSNCIPQRRLSFTRLISAMLRSMVRSCLLICFSSGSLRLAMRCFCRWRMARRLALAASSGGSLLRLSNHCAALSVAMTGLPTRGCAGRR